MVRDMDIPVGGRAVKCGYCSVTWHQMPVVLATKTPVSKSTSPTNKEINKSSAINVAKASDGNTYKFTGVQWQRLLSSGKTGIFAKRAISQELNKLTGKKIIKKIKGKRKNFNPSSQSLPDIYQTKKGVGFFGYIFLIIILSLCTVWIIKISEDYWLSYFPQDILFFAFIDEQLDFFAETFKNVITIVKDLMNSY